MVERQVRQQDGTYLLVLTDGRELTINLDQRPIIYGSQVASMGELILAGDDPKPFVARLPDNGDCFWIGGRGTEEGAFVATAVGLRLPKAANFDRAHYPETEHEFNGGGFCVSTIGEVTAIQ